MHQGQGGALRSRWKRAQLPHGHVGHVGQGQGSFGEPAEEAHRSPSHAAAGIRWIGGVCAASFAAPRLLFFELARDHSDDPTAKNGRQLRKLWEVTNSPTLSLGGDLGAVERGSLQPKVEACAVRTHARNACRILLRAGTFSGGCLRSAEE